MHNYQIVPDRICQHFMDSDLLCERNSVNHEKLKTQDTFKKFKGNYKGFRENLTLDSIPT